MHSITSITISRMSLFEYLPLDEALIDLENTLVYLKALDCLCLYIPHIDMI